MFTRLAFGATPYVGDVLVVLSLRGGHRRPEAVVPAARSSTTLRGAGGPNIAVPQGQLLPLDASSACTRRWRRSSRSVRRRHARHRARRRAWPSRTVRTSPRWRRWSGPRRAPRCAPGWLDRVLGLREHGARRSRRRRSARTAPPRRSSGRRPSSRCGSSTPSSSAGAWDATRASRWDEALRGVHDGAPAVDARRRRSPRSTRSSTAAQLQRRRIHAGERRRLSRHRPRRRAARRRPADQGRRRPAGRRGRLRRLGHARRTGRRRRRLDGRPPRRALAARSPRSRPTSGTGDGRRHAVTLTEFGRRVEENGSGGTDHGFGQAVSC